MLMRKAIVTSLLLLVGITLGTSAHAKAKDIQIVVEPSGANRYKVSVTFDGDSSGRTEIHLPNEWGGQKDLYKAISGLSVSSSAATITDGSEPHRRIITHNPAEPLTVSYFISQDFQGPFGNAVRYRPVTDSKYIHWIGSTVWVLPAWNETDEVKVAFEWKNLPGIWTFAHSFGTGTRNQHFNAEFDDLRTSLYVAGDFRFVTVRAAGKPVIVGVRGEWQFSDAEMAEAIRKVIELQRAFWKDNSQERFLVSLIPIDEGPNSFSFGGTGLTDSFALFATPNATVDRLRALLAHEYAHNWIPTRVGRMPDREQELYWFSEGFTEFYTYELLHRSKIITTKEYVDLYNSLIREYYSLPTRNEPNERIVKDFWADPYVGRLPYLRGLMFATNLNAEMKRKSGGKRSLDNVMFDLTRVSHVKPQPLSFESLATAFAKHTGASLSDLMQRQLIQGETIEPVDDALGGIAEREMMELSVFELGFDFDRFAKERVVVGVIPNSAAYAAGLRNGQKRNGGVSISFGDTTREIELKVKDDAGERSIKYLPVANQRLQVPQFKLK